MPLFIASGFLGFFDGSDAFDYLNLESFRFKKAYDFASDQV